jgi:hypothetical protein
MIRTVAISVSVLTIAIGGCAPLTAQRLADDSFRRGLAAHVRGYDAEAEVEYRRALSTGVATSATYNNLALLAAKRHDYVAAHRLLADARQLRLRTACQVPSMGRVNWESEECIRATEALDQIAARYLARIAQAEARAHLAREPLVVADLQLGRM